MHDFNHQVALSSNCKKSQFLITFYAAAQLVVIIPGSIIPQKIAMADTFNLRYITANSDRFEGGKQPFVYKSEQMALLQK